MVFGCKNDLKMTWCESGVVEKTTPRLSGRRSGVLRVVEGSHRVGGASVELGCERLWAACVCKVRRELTESVGHGISPICAVPC